MLVRMFAGVLARRAACRHGRPSLGWCQGGHTLPWVAGLDGTIRSRSEHEVTKWQTGKPARRWNGIRFG